MTEIKAPKRVDVVIEDDGRQTIRLNRFFNELTSDIDTINTTITTLTSETADDLTIIWTTNEPTSSTVQTIADGSSPTALETGQAIQNLVTRINALQQAMRDAGLLST